MILKPGFFIFTYFLIHLVYLCDPEMLQVLYHVRLHTCKFIISDYGMAKLKQKLRV